MFQESFAEVVVSVRCGQKELNFLFDINFNQTAQVLLTQLMQKIRLDAQFNDQGDIFYFDHLKTDYVKIVEGTQVSAFNMINQNKIMIRFDPKMSDQVLANPLSRIQLLKMKRSSERGIREAFGLVLRWRRLYLWGEQNEKGQLKKYNLDQASQQLGIPRKSLEDYFLLLRVGRDLGFNFCKHRNDKIGVLRKFIKSMPKREKEREKYNLKQEAKQKIRVLEDKFFRDLGRQLQSQMLTQKGQQKLYDVLEIESSKSFSDEDMVQQFES